MTLSQFERKQICGILNLSGELSPSLTELPQTKLFLWSIVNNDNLYTSLTCMLPIFKRSHGFSEVVADGLDDLFGGFAEKKRRLVIDRYFQHAYLQLASGDWQTLAGIEATVELDLRDALYSLYADIGRLLSATVEAWDDEQVWSVAEELGLLTETDLLDTDYQLIRVKLTSKLSAYESEIQSFVSAQAPGLRSFWQSLRCFGAHYGHFIRARALKLLLVLRLCEMSGLIPAQKESLIHTQIDCHDQWCWSVRNTHKRLVRISLIRLFLNLKVLPEQDFSASYLERCLRLVNVHGATVGSLLRYDSVQRNLFRALQQLIPGWGKDKLPLEKTNVVAFSRF